MGRLGLMCAALVLAAVPLGMAADQRASDALIPVGISDVALASSMDGWVPLADGSVMRTHMDPATGMLLLILAGEGGAQFRMDVDGDARLDFAVAITGEALPTSDAQAMADEVLQDALVGSDLRGLLRERINKLGRDIGHPTPHGTGGRGIPRGTIKPHGPGLAGWGGKIWHQTEGAGGGGNTWWTDGSREHSPGESGRNGNEGEELPWNGDGSDESDIVFDTDTTVDVNLDLHEDTGSEEFPGEGQEDDGQKPHKLGTPGVVVDIASLLEAARQLEIREHFAHRYLRVWVSHWAPINPAPDHGGVRGHGVGLGGTQNPEGEDDDGSGAELDYMAVTLDPWINPGPDGPVMGMLRLR